MEQRYFTRPSAANPHGGTAADDGGRAGPGGTAGHQQPPPPPSAAAPPTEGGPCSGPAATRVCDWCHFSVGQFIPDSGHRPHTSPTDDHRITVRGRLFPGTRQTPQPPAEESDVPRPGRGPKAAHDESAAPAVQRHSSIHRTLSSTATLGDDGTRPTLSYCRAGRSSLRRRHHDWRQSRRRRVRPASAMGRGGAARTAGRHPATLPAPTARRRRLAGRQVLGWRRVPGPRGVQSRRRVPGSSLKQCSTDVIV